jgi:phosphatidylglycerophosphate synthase
VSTSSRAGRDLDAERLPRRDRRARWRREDAAVSIPPSTFIEPGHAGGHALPIGGLPALERVIRACAADGVRRVEVPAAPIDVARGGVAHGVEVVWLPPGARPRADQPVVAGDTLEGVQIVDERSRRRAEWRVLRGLPKRHQGATDALLNWRASLPITRVLARTRLSPNHVTLIATAVGVAACAVVLLGTCPALAAGGVLLQAHSVLDSCDGELARLRYQFSRLGEWLDNVTDEIVDDGFAVCVGVVAGGPWFWLGLVGGARSLAIAAQLAEVYRRTGSGNPYAFRWWFERDKVTAAEVWDRRTALYWLRALGRRDTYVFLWMLLLLAGQPAAVAAFAAVNGALVIGMTLAHVALRGRAR